MKKLMLVLVASACCSAFTMNASAQQADQATSDAIIAMVKAQWASEIKEPTNVAEQSKEQDSQAKGRQMIVDGRSLQAQAEGNPQAGAGA